MAIKDQKKILVVDDDRHMRDSLKEALEASGFRVEVARDGESALELITQKSLSLDYAILDQVLEGMDGIDLTKQLQKIFPKLPVIVFSGKQDLKLTKEAIEAGVYKYIYKPFTIESIKEILDELVLSIEDWNELQTQLTVFHGERKWLQTMLEELGTGICILDRNFRIWYINKKLKEMTRNSIHVGGTCWVEYHHRTEQTTPCPNCPSNRMFRSEKIESETLLPFIRGEFRYFETIATPIRGKGGRIIGSIETITDITERERLFVDSLEAGATPDINRRVEIILRSIKNLGYDRAQLFRISNDGKEVVGWQAIGEGYSAKFEGLRSCIEANPYLKKTIYRKKPQIYRREVDLPYLNSELGKEDIDNWIEMSLQNEHQLLGILVIDNKFSQREFSERDIEKLKPFKKLIESSITSHQEQNAILERSRFLQLLREFDIGISEKHRLQDVLDYAMQFAGKSTTASSGYLCILVNNQPEPTAGFGELAYSKIDNLAFTCQDMWYSHKEIKPTKYLIVSNTATNFDFQQWKEKIIDAEVKQKWDKIGCISVFPLVLREQAIGAIYLLSEQKDFFTPVLCSFIESLCQRAAIAIDLVQLLEKEHQRVRELEQLREIDIEIAKAENLESIAEIFLAKALKLVGGDSGFIRLTNDKGDKLVLLTGMGEYWKNHAKRILDLGEESSGKVFTSGKPLVVPNTDEDDFCQRKREELRQKGISESSLVKIIQIKSYICFPVMVGDQKFGTINMESVHYNFFNNAKLALIEKLNERAIIVIKKTKLLEEVRRNASQRQRELDFFYDISKRFSEPFDIQVLLDSLAEEICASMGAKRCLIFCQPFEENGLNHNTVKLKATNDPKMKSFIGTASYSKNEGLTGNIFATGELINESDVNESRKKGIAKDKYEIGCQNYLGAPLRFRDDIFGVIALNDKLTEEGEINREGFSNEDKKVLELISLSISLVIKNVQLFNQILSEEKLDAWGQISAEMAHKIRMPLLLIKEWLAESQQDIEKKVKRHKFTENFEMINAKISEMFTAISRFLQWRGRQMPEYKSLNIVDTLNTVILEILSSNPRISTNVPLHQTVMVQYDEEMIKSCITEIVMNALGYMKSGGTLSCEVAQLEGKVKISISDTGKGIRLEEKQKIFDPTFYVKSKKSGFGLGLLIIKRLIEQYHYGQVYEDGFYERGARLNIELPLKQTGKKDIANKGKVKIDG